MLKKLFQKCLIFNFNKEAMFSKYLIIIMAAYFPPPSSTTKVLIFNFKITTPTIKPQHTPNAEKIISIVHTLLFEGKGYFVSKYLLILAVYLRPQTARAYTRL